MVKFIVVKHGYRWVVETAINPKVPYFADVIDARAFAGYLNRQESKSCKP